MPQTIINGQWTLINKRTIGDKGYRFRAVRPTIIFPAGCGCDQETTLIPTYITLVVNVLERGSQRVYFELDESFDPNDCQEDESGAWNGYAMITPVENEDLHAATLGWEPGVPFPRTFELDFRPVSADLRYMSVYGKLPRLS